MELLRASQDLEAMSKRPNPNELQLERLQTRVDELTQEIEDGKEELKGREKEQYLTLRRKTVIEARRNLTGNVDLLRARDCVLYNAEDKEASEILEMIRTRHRREFGRDLPAAQTAGD